MDFLPSLFYFILAFGVLVVIHEMGHFLAARLTGMRVDTFAVGMGKRLLGYNKRLGFTLGALPKDWVNDGTTDYRIALIPIGGYVKISGMIDESMDTDFAKSEPKEWEFRSKNAWQKAFVISAGVIMNALLTLAIFAGIALYQGKTVIETTTIGSVDKGSFAEKSGILPGDKILKINNINMRSWDQIIESLALDNLGSSKSILIQRNNTTIPIRVSGKQIVKDMADQKSIGINPSDYKTFILSVIHGKPAYKVGLAKGDTILAINGVKVSSLTHFSELIKQNKGNDFTILWKKGSLQRSATLKTDQDGMIGVQYSHTYTGPIKTYEYNLLTALQFGYTESIRSIDLFFSSISEIFKGTISVQQAVGGPVMIAKQANQRAELGFIPFIHFVALLSITLAIINIMPFPALDGGHLVFIILEGISRKEVPVKIKMAFQNIGMILLLLLMVFVFYIDLTR